MKKYDFSEFKPEVGAYRATLAVKRLRKKRRIKELENYIVKCPKSIVRYCRLIKERWEEAEQVLLQKGSAHDLYEYCYYVLNNTWKEAEHIIIKDRRSSFAYAKNLLKKRWPEAEKIIIEQEIKLIKQETKDDSFFSYDYTFLEYFEHFFEERWIEAEEIFNSRSEFILSYFKKLETVPEEMHNKMICYSLSRNEEDKENAKEYLEEISENNKKMLRRLKNFDPNITIKELMEKLK